MTGLIPFCAVAVAEPFGDDKLAELRSRVSDFLSVRPEYAGAVQLATAEEPVTMLAVVDHDALPRVLERLGDEAEFLSPHGIRSLSAIYRGRPFEFWQAGEVASTVDYEPAESTTALFGGNSNWRGPIWFPVNYLIIGALLRFSRRYETLRVEFPRGSGQQLTLREITIELAERLVRIFLEDSDGRRPVFGGQERFQADPAWHDSLFFHEYFHGDDGAGLGASHQTGWTGLVADMVVRLSNARQGADA
jgi:hypothetical protein